MVLPPLAVQSGWDQDFLMAKPLRWYRPPEYTTNEPCVAGHYHASASIHHPYLLNTALHTHWESFEHIFAEWGCHFLWLLALCDLLKICQPIHVHCLHRTGLFLRCRLEGIAHQVACKHFAFHQKCKGRIETNLQTKFLTILLHPTACVHGRMLGHVGHSLVFGVSNLLQQVFFSLYCH